MVAFYYSTTHNEGPIISQMFEQNLQPTAFLHILYQNNMCS